MKRLSATSVRMCSRYVDRRSKLMTEAKSPGGTDCDNLRGVKQAPPGNIMTVRALAEYLRVHPSTIYRLLRQRKLPAFKVGSDWRFSREAIDHWRLTYLEPKQ